MRFGKLMLGHNREARMCLHCGVEMEAGSQYAAMNYVGVGPESRSFTIRMHRDCLFPWCEARMAAQKDGRKKEWSKEPRVGRVPTNTTEPQLKYRKKIQFYLFDSKTTLIRAYLNRDSEQVRQTWLRLARWLTVYGDESQVGKTTQYRLGIPAMEAITEGGDGDFIAVLAAAGGMPLEMARVIEERWS